MNRRRCVTSLFLSVLLSSLGRAAPLIDPIAAVTIPAGKSLIVPVTATSANGPLTYTVTSSTNGIAVVMHTNNPFWQLSVAQVAQVGDTNAYQTPYRGGLATVTNVGNLTFMLFPEYAPHTVNVFQGLTTSGFYNSNTIFHRVLTNFVIQGGDPLTNGMGGLVFTYDDEFNPQAMFSGNGQLALANSGKDTDGSQFFVAIGAQRPLDFGYTIFGQLVRGFDVLTNISNTAVDTNSRPLADEIIQTASYVPDTADTVLTLIATNRPGVTGTITVIADDGVGGRTTNVFAATLVADTNSNSQPFIYPNTVTNLVAPVNTTLMNFFNAVELDSEELYWFPSFVTEADYNNAPNSSYNLLNNRLHTLAFNVTNVDGRFQLFLVPVKNYAGPVSLVFDISNNSQWDLYREYGLSLPNYDQQFYTFVFGDTPVSGQTNIVAALASVPFNNILLATFTNGVPGSSSANFTAAINWGDNSTNSGVVTANAAGEKAVLGSHAYVYPGTYPVYVQVQSVIGASATVLSFVTVTNQAAAATNLLTVQVTGSGTVSSGYSNALLAVGGSYSISAIPADLSVLASWTDGNGFVLGAGTNLAFTMYPGLRLTANFVLATNPSLTIASPSSGRVITNLYSAPATVTGTAANNATITNVWYQANSGGWQEASGTTQWTASFIPAYGVTNRFQAYAVNNFGYVSPTSSVSVLYLAGDVLTVNTNGLGKITPVLNGHLLPLGTNYVLTATPASGFAFTNWTGSVFATNAVLKFTMATNMSLTANFVDQAKPVIAIANLVNGQRVIYAGFTVEGTASDNWQVTNVWLQLNGGNWTNAVSANNWANWSASLSLVEGTNKLSVYAVDNTGNISTTNSVSFTYVVSAPLQVQTTGLGTLSPNYSNAWLAINQSYNMTAAPRTGFVFTNWTGGTNPPLAVLTNGRTVRFSMTSNLTLQANFVDVTKPACTITLPTPNQRWSNAVFTVKGTAKDNVQVSNVWCLTNGAWGLTTTTNGWTNWTVQVALVPGTNTVRAYAADGAGNLSVTSSVSFVYVPCDHLMVVISGQGSVSPNYSNAFLPVGSNFMMTATARAGYLFSNWTGGVSPSMDVLTNKPALRFTMQSNLVLQANFIPNPFIPVAGTYQGLFYDTNNGVEQLSSGFFSGTVGTNGVFTAKLQQGLNSYPLSGQFSLTGAWFTNSIKGAGNLTAWLQLDLSGQDVLTGVLSNASWTAQLTADRAVYSKSNPAPQVGKYTLVMPGSANATEEPGGNGFGSVNIDTNGNVTFLGALGDGTKVIQSSIVSQQGQWPLYLALYSGKGSLLGWLTFTNEADRDIDGLLSWIKPAGTITNLYPAGFTNGPEAMGSAYVFTNGLRVLNLTNGVLLLDNGNLAQALTNSLVLGTNNVVSGTNLSRLTITNTTGLFGGSLTNPATGKAIAISGAVLQKQNAGYGYFLGTNQSGSVQLGQ